MLIVALFTITERMKQSKYPFMGKWINKMWAIHTIELFSLKKEEKSDILNCYLCFSSWVLQDRN